MWVEFVVGSLPFSERFFSGYSGFPLSSKTNISKFKFDQESGRRRTTMWMYYLQIVIYSFIYLALLADFFPFSANAEPGLRLTSTRPLSFASQLWRPLLRAASGESSPDDI